LENGNVTLSMTSFPVCFFSIMAPNKGQCCEVVKLYYESRSFKTVVKTMKSPWLNIENIEQVKTAIGETPQRSVRRILGDISNSTSFTMLRL